MFIMIKKINIGDRFAYLTAEQPGMGKVAKWQCKCFCGNYVVVRSSSLLSGKTQSCGCMSSAIRNESFYSNREEMVEYLKEIQKALKGQFDLLEKVEKLKKWIKKQ